MPLEQDLDRCLRQNGMANLAVFDRNMCEGSSKAFFKSGKIPNMLENLDRLRRPHSHSGVLDAPPDPQRVPIPSL